MVFQLFIDISKCWEVLCSIVIEFVVPMKYAFRKVQETQRRMELNGTYQLLVYDVINLLDKT
jgi:hypothetical protein